MKTKKLILIVTLGIIVLFVLLIGTGTIKINCFVNEMSDRVSSNWNNSSSIGQYNDSKEEIPFPAISVIVIYKSKIIGDMSAPNPIKIDISDKDFGSLGFPFIKKSDYKFSVIINENYEVKTSNALGRFAINGEINVSGHYKFIGLSSAKTVTNLVVDKVMKDIYDDVKKHLK